MPSITIELPDDIADDLDFVALRNNISREDAAVFILTRWSRDDGRDELIEYGFRFEERPDDGRVYPDPFDGLSRPRLVGGHPVVWLKRTSTVRGWGPVT